MAAFTYVDQGVYTFSGDTATFQGETNGTDTITDNEADGTFEFGDTLFISGNNVGTFAGSIIVNGAACIVVERNSSQFILSESPVPAGGFPITYSISGDLDTSDFPVCFAAGTMIATLDGACAVEALAIGDPILTADGRAVPVKWIGRQTMHKVFTPAERFAPVRVKAGALGQGIPHSDLVLTADHALILEDLAITAGALVNGTTIDFDPVEALPERVTYYHVETEDHSVILANGVPAETFLDQVGRRAFDNHAEYAALYGEERRIAEMPHLRISSARLVPPAIRARLGKAVAA